MCLFSNMPALHACVRDVTWAWQKGTKGVLVVCKLVLEIMQMCGLFVNLCLCDVQLSCVRGGASCKARG